MDLTNIEDLQCLLEAIKHTIRYQYDLDDDQYQEFTKLIEYFQDKLNTAPEQKLSKEFIDKYLNKLNSQ